MYEKGKIPKERVRIYFSVIALQRIQKMSGIIGKQS
jgi:hypothetical protein